MSSPTFPELAGRTAVITGAATGIGRAIAIALSRQSVRVAICDVDASAAAAAAAALGAGAIALEMDVRQRESVTTAFAEVEATFGGYDILVANAGVSTMRHALDLTDDEWDYNFNVNARGIFLTNQIAARRFKSQGHGVIVNTGSLAKSRRSAARPLLPPVNSQYRLNARACTRAGSPRRPGQCRLPRLCEHRHARARSRLEAALRGVSPERVIEDYIAETPLGRLKRPEDVADVAVFLCSNRSLHDRQGVNGTGGVY